MGLKRVVVAMSGGVDSSTAAALLKDKGFEVIGITMQIWQRPQDNSGCCGIGSIEDARKVAYRLGIPHYVLNFRDIFKKKVVADFCQEYKEGKTPNPCIRCNQFIKFDHLLKKAKQLGAEYVATGHYARIVFDKRKKRYLLKKGIDPRKDQSYVLYTMTQKQLKYTLMPLGSLTKEKVRKIARKKDLAVADKPESQEICFIPDNNYGRFLKERFPGSAKPGPIINKEGKILGKHKGIIFYTIGQRKGIGIAARRPLYVISIDKKKNTIVVGEKEDGYMDKLIADDLNFIYMDKLRSPIKAKVKVRYLHPAASATLSLQGEAKARVKFSRPQWAVTPGQAAVFYKGDIVIGGGTICGSDFS